MRISPNSGFSSPQLRAAALLAGCLLLGLLLPACGINTPQLPTATPPEGAITQPSPTPAVPTATPALRRLAFWAGADADPALLTAVEELAAGSGLELFALESLTAGGLDESVRLVVAVPRDAQEASALSDLAQSLPDQRFLALGSNVPQPGQNLSVVSAPADQVAFLAGYTAALVTPNWWVGVLNRVDTPTGQAGRDYFLNGVGYACGICYAPGKSLPNLGVADVSGEDGWRAGIQALKGQGITTVFLIPELDTPEVQAAVAEAGLMFVNSRGEVSAGLKSRWVATLGVDLVGALREAWPSLLDGEPGQQIAVPVTVQAANPEILTEARLRLVEETAQALRDGVLFPGNVSLE